MAEVITSRTLKSAVNHDSEYLKAFWDVMRYLYLLRKISIAHGEISLVKIIREEIGALSDLELATVMEVGSCSPKEMGWERTGTLPFMALDLLEFCNREIKRWFRHDLESGAWCLAWQMLYEESEHRKWYSGTFESISDHKHRLLNKFERMMIKKDWRDYFHVMDSWLSEWSRIYREMDSRSKVFDSPAEKFEEREKYNEKHPDEEFIQTAVNLARKYGLDNVEALRDTSWIGVQLLPGPPQPK